MSSTTAIIAIGSMHPNDGCINASHLAQLHEGSRATWTLHALGAARLNDWAWRIGGRGYATVSPSPGHHVWGAIWNVSDSDLARLDRYEGVAGGLYRREFTTVMAKNQPIDVLIYIENYDDHGMPRPDYLERIIAGARWFDLPQAWIDDLAAVPV